MIRIGSLRSTEGNPMPPPQFGGVINESYPKMRRVRWENITA
jgi:hypothetical protein